ncbi:unnamed protein product [Heligmosomoides polygyrus]|uniref:Trafficking protein particle complex subunit n=1 Tax=Heligmosomoides polygyrus TaxID=6339 RepID=A0A183GFU9_HELPZ|nr:unnamed protein product [Heligmosomoides polygyrus]
MMKKTESENIGVTLMYDIKRAGYIIVTHREEDQDVLNPLVMQAAMQLWSLVQSLTVEDDQDRRINYPGICVKFPIPPEFSITLHKFFSPNITTIPPRTQERFVIVSFIASLLISMLGFQSLTVEDDQDRRINYPGICVKFPIPPEFSITLHKFFSPNITT